MSTQKDSFFMLLAKAGGVDFNEACSKFGTEHRQNRFRYKTSQIVPHKSRWPEIAKAFGVTEAQFWQCFQKAFKFSNLK